MIKKVKNSLTIKIFLLMSALLLAASMLTYGAVAGFLPAYYSSQIKEDLDLLSKEMADTISSHKTIEEAANVIELFEAGSGVSVVILDEEGRFVWPQMDEGTEMANIASAMEETDVTFEEEQRIEGIAQVQDHEEEAAEIQEGMAEDSSIVQDAEDAQEEWIREILNTDNSASAVKHYALKVGKKPYTMLVSGGMQPVNQAMEILKQIFPYILLISAGIAVLCALGSSVYLTAPVVRLSRLSKKMAALDFSGVYEGKRTDEVGILGRNMNEMSSNLSGTLSALQEANAKLKSDIEMEREIERKRIAFFSAVSHELKTPITILKGHLNGMLQGIGSYSDRDYYLKRSRETTDKMEDMVQELLTVSRIESRKFTAARTDIAEQLRLQLAELTELMEEKELTLEAEIPEHVYAAVNPPMMEKVFRNLLMNAIRYTPEAEGNEIRVSVIPGENEEKTITCIVENTGVHIDEDAIPHLFEAFYRVEQSRNRQSGGSGLGLYIVKMILEQHGAKYEIKNTRDGVGFFFSISEDSV